MSPHFFVEPLDQEIVLTIKHCLKTNAADISVRRPVDDIAEGHVVGRHGFGDRARSTAYLEKATGDLLTGADFSEGAVLLGVEIDLEGLLVGPYVHLWIHRDS